MTATAKQATAILVDDEAALLNHLERQLAVAWPELRVVDTAQNGREALSKIRDQVPDVVFLDIKMPGLSGLDVAKQLSADAVVVFVTAYDNFAVEAFEAAAADYLLKPIDPKRLEQTVARVQQQLDREPATDTDNLHALLQQLANSTDVNPRYLEWLKAGHGDEVALIASSDVVYLQSNHKYTSVYTADAEHVIRTSLAELEQQLNPKQFWRIHRGIIVAVNEIASARRDLRGRYTLKLRSRPETVRSSVAYKHLFAQM